MVEEVDDEVRWDIDRITLEPVLLRQDLSGVVRFVVGTIVGGILWPVFGGLMGLLLF